MQPPTRALLQVAPLALAVLVIGWLAPGARAEEPIGGRYGVAPPGPCAEAVRLVPCPGGTCEGAAPARSRFDPVDVAAGLGTDGPGPPDPTEFAGPGSCVDPSTPCGAVDPRATRGSGVIETPPGPAPPP
jgi:hypothetical protein